MCGWTAGVCPLLLTGERLGYRSGRTTIPSSDACVTCHSSRKQAPLGVAAATTAQPLISVIQRPALAGGAGDTNLVQFRWRPGEGTRRLVPILVAALQRCRESQHRHRACDPKRERRHSPIGKEFRIDWSCWSRRLERWLGPRAQGEALTLRVADALLKLRVFQAHELCARRGRDRRLGGGG